MVTSSAASKTCRADSWISWDATVGAAGPLKPRRCLVIHELLEAIGRFIMNVELQTGYLGLVMLMGIESACIPLPSEVIMPFAGTLVLAGKMNLWLAALAGAIGCN